MLFNNFLNDGEAKPRTRCPIGDIGLHNPLAILRQTDAIVRYADDQPIAFDDQIDDYRAIDFDRFLLLLYRFNRIFQNVRDRLTQLAPV